MQNSHPLQAMQMTISCIDFLIPHMHGTLTKGLVVVIELVC